MLIISTIKDVPNKKSLSLIRSIYLIPGLVCAAILASSGTNIIWVTTTTTDTTKNLNTSEVWSESTSQTNKIPLQSPVWQTAHMMIFLTLLAYVIQQITIFITKHDKKDIE